MAWSFNPEVINKENESITATANYLGMTASYSIPISVDNIVYNLTPVEGGTSAYNDAGTTGILINGVNWFVYGNTETQPWKIGGNEIEKQDRHIKTSTPIYGTVEKVVVNVGGTSGDITLNSIKLSVANNASFTNSTNYNITDNLKANKDYVFQTHIRIKRDEEYIWTKITFVFIPTTDELEVDRVFILIQDYSSAMAERMTNLMYARIDALTQTWNRRYSEELISNRIKSNTSGLFSIFDVDDFKIVNDLFGHITGDQLLKKISHVVSESISEEDVFGRLGGDEFVLYLKGDFDDCLTHFISIMEKLKFNYFENDRKISITCSAGVAKIKGRRTSFTELYESADAALYDAKRSGKSTYKISMASLIEEDDDE